MKTYDFNAANLELMQMAIQRCKAVTSIEECHRAQLLGTEGAVRAFISMHLRLGIA